MIYRVRHTTSYSYGTPVDLATHMLHLLPRPAPWQDVLSASLAVTPPAGFQHEALDHFGNRVAWLFLDRPHRAFEVTAEARVAVAGVAPPDATATPPWERVAAAARAGGPDGWEAAEYVFESPMVPVTGAACAYAAASFPPARPVLAGLLDLNARIRRDFRFQPGVTELATPIDRVLAQRAGVCQDFSHVMISGLRGLGLPARYVSGYVRTWPPPGQERRRGADVSHAWVGAWLGPAHGWIDLDPTNNLVVQDEHVLLGYGRDYADVSPVRGIILGGGAHALSVSVDLEPEAA